MLWTPFSTSFSSTDNTLETQTGTVNKNGSERNGSKYCSHPWWSVILVRTRLYAVCIHHCRGGNNGQFCLHCSQENFRELQQLQHTSNMSLSSHIFPHWPARPLAVADDWGPERRRNAFQINYHVVEARDNVKFMWGVERHTNAMSVFWCDSHLKRTAFLCTERNADTGLSSAAFLTIWSRAKERHDDRQTAPR